MPKDNRDFFKYKKIWAKVKDEFLGYDLMPYFNKILSMGNPKNTGVVKKDDR